MEFGLAMSTGGYNMFMSGPTGTGKTTYAETKVREVARERPAPSDWCYVYNFDEPDRPTALGVSAGPRRALSPRHGGLGRGGSDRNPPGL